MKEEFNIDFTIFKNYGEIIIDKSMPPYKEYISAYLSVDEWNELHPPLDELKINQNKLG